ncbi:MAG: single-stranded-DNA-specific exonuclease RecJ, partial [Candidatus Angelobacter sp.]
MRWKHANPDGAIVERLRADTGIPSIIARLLVIRGISDAASANRFLTPSLEHLHSPYLMRGMKEAVERIVAAIASRENILIYGDYDVDGTTAVVILK